MSQAVDNFLGGAVIVPVLALLLFFGGCELVCNSMGYTLGTDVVGPLDRVDEPFSETQELAWKCAGFRRRSAGDWGYSGQYDQAACRELRDLCEHEYLGCYDWQSIQQGKIGWGHENARFFTPLDRPYKSVSIELLTGEHHR